MSKTKTSKFNDSGNMLPFFLASIGLGIDLIYKVSFLHFNTWMPGSKFCFIKKQAWKIVKIKKRQIVYEVPCNIIKISTNVSGVCPLSKW